MMNIDSVIAEMKQSDCINCECEEATFDDSSEVVKLIGSFCNIVNEYDQIEIKAIKETTGEVIWSKMCNTGKMCSIPFTSQLKFNCHE